MTLFSRDAERSAFALRSASRLNKILGTPSTVSVRPLLTRYLATNDSTELGRKTGRKEMGSRRWFPVSKKKEKKVERSEGNMANGPLSLVLRHIRRIAGATMANDIRDDQLLQRFIVARDEEAFGVLMTRHGPMVLRLCRRLLGEEQEAEDAFQAVFFVLARRAESVRQHDCLAGWLHRVAWRIAVRARQAAAKRRTVALPQEVAGNADPVAEAGRREECAIVDEELLALPERYRLPIVLCCLEERSRSEAARLLGWKEGTVGSRLARGRELLRRRLLRRGIALSAGVFMPLGTMSAALAQNTLRLAVLVGAGEAALTPTVALLVKDAIRTMLMHKLKSVVGVFLVLSVLAAGGGWTAYHNAFPRAENPPTPDQPAPFPAAVKAHEDKPSGLDRLGDPLPPRAIKRFGSIRLRHVVSVKGIAWSPNGKLLASCGRTVRLWDTATGRLVRSFKYAASYLAFTPDGKTLIGGADGVICLWEIDTGKERLHLDAFSAKERERAKEAFGMGGGRLPHTSSIAVSADGRFLAAGGSHLATVWDIRAGKKCVAVGEQMFTDYVAFTSDGKSLITASIGKSVRIWNVQSGKQTGGFTVEGPDHEENIFSLAVSSDGKHAAMKLKNQLVVVALASGKVVWREKSKGYEKEGFAFSPDGRLLAFADRKGVRIGEWASGRQLKAIRTDGDDHFSNGVCVFSADGKRLAWAEGDQVVLWDLAAGKESPPLDEYRNVGGMFALCPDGKTCVTIGGTVRLWDTASARATRAIPLPKNLSLYSRALSRDGRTLFLGDYNSTITTVDLRGQEKPRSHTGSVKERYLIAISPDGTSALATDPHSHVTHLVGDAGRNWRDRSKPPLNAIDAIYTFDSKRLLVNSDDYLVYLDAIGGREIWRSEKSLGRFNPNYYKGSLAASPDGRWVAAGSEWQWGPPDKGCVRLFDADNGRERAKLKTPYHSIHALAVSGDSRFLLAASSPYCFAYSHSAEEAKCIVVSLWEVANGTEIRRFHGHDYLINALHFAPDGRTFYSASADGTVLQWDAFGRYDALPPWPDRPDVLWDQLADNDAAKAYRAVARLAASPRQACTLLDKHLHAVQAVSAKRLAELVRDLDSESFTTREAVTHELRSLGEQADAVLHQTLKNHPPLEVRRRIDALLEERRARPYAPEELQRCRAILLLEWIGSAEARRLLQRLAAGTAKVSHVSDARAALKRLGKQTKGKSLE